jgi:dTDP-glucose pyrophosphorylase
MSGYVGVILAGGRGRRMGGLGDEIPKALLPVANEPMVGHQLRLMRSLGVRDVHVVIGYRATDVVTTLGDGETYGVKLHYVDQGPSLGSAHALGCLRAMVDRPFLLTLGDYYFMASDPARLIRRLDEGASVIAAKREANPRALAEACVVEADGAGRVVGITEKPYRPRSDLKGCGLCALQPDVFDAVARTPRTALRDEFELMVALDVFVKMGHPLYVDEAIVWDANLTRPDDLLECNLQWLRRAGLNELVAHDAHVEPGVQIERSVVGTRTHLRDRSRLQEVVVFPEATVKGGEAIVRALVTPRSLYVCR